MVLDGKLRWFPAIHAVARGALRPARPFGELAIMRVRFVAVHALLKSERLLEISAAMALYAVDCRMLPKQRVLRFRVIETLTDCGG